MTVYLTLRFFLWNSHLTCWFMSFVSRIWNIFVVTWISFLRLIKSQENFLCVCVWWNVMQIIICVIGFNKSCSSWFIVRLSPAQYGCTLKQCQCWCNWNYGMVAWYRLIWCVLRLDHSCRAANGWNFFGNGQMKYSLMAPSNVKPHALKDNQIDAWPHLMKDTVEGLFYI